MLSTSHRFHGLGSLNFAYKKGSTVRSQLLSLKYARNQRRTSYRAAVVVSRKVHKSAVVRNRIRRRIYAVLETELGAKTPPYDLVVTVFSDKVADCEYTELRQQLIDLLKKAKLDD